jgi:hypothetical protein
MAFNIGLTGPYDFDGVVKPDFFAAMTLFYQDRYPLVTRLSTRPVSAMVVKAIDDDYRPRSTTVTDANGLTNSVTTITVGAAFRAQVGDVLELASGEKAIVTAVNGTALTVTRGYAGTTANAQAVNTTVQLVTNARTGAEVDQDAITNVPDTSLTTPQTVQHAYQIGGALEATSANMAIPTGFGSLVGYQRAKAAQELLHDFAGALYYGEYQAHAADLTRVAMRGLRQRIATNKVTSPTNASAYKPSDFERDVIKPCYDAGGAPDVVMLSNDYRQAFVIWGMALLENRETDSTFGVDFTTFKCPAVSASIVFDRNLRAGTAVALTSGEVFMGWKRMPMDYPRGRRGDAAEGDVIGEGCIVANNEKFHSWTQGVTGFAKQS